MLFMPRIIFQMPDGTQKTVNAEIGDYLTDVAHKNDIELSDACGGNATCGTCHVHFTKDTFEKLADSQPASDDEEDTLEVVNQRIDCSRLGCQVKVTGDMDGAIISIPE